MIMRINKKAAGEGFSWLVGTVIILIIIFISIVAYSAFIKGKNLTIDDSSDGYRFYDDLALQRIVGYTINYGIESNSVGNFNRIIALHDVLHDSFSYALGKDTLSGNIVFSYTKYEGDRDYRYAHFFFGTDGYLIVSKQGSMPPSKNVNEYYPVYFSDKKILSFFILNKNKLDNIKK